MEKDVLCHLCNGKMWREKETYRCSRCNHVAEAVPPPSEAEILFKDELEYKESITRYGSGASNTKGAKPRPKRGTPWYDIDRIAAEGSPGQGFKE